MEEIINMSKTRYVQLSRMAQMNEELLIKLVRGLEDIRRGRIKNWREAVKEN